MDTTTTLTAEAEELRLTIVTDLQRALTQLARLQAHQGLPTGHRSGLGVAEMYLQTTLLWVASTQQ